jgi:hypothetical protein
VLFLTYLSRSVGLDCQVINRQSKKFSTFKPISVSKKDKDDEIVDTREIVYILANLAVRRDKRKAGIAKALMRATDSFVAVSLVRSLVIARVVECEVLSCYSWMLCFVQY